jgi:hydrogenase maturation protein HypF
MEKGVAEKAADTRGGHVTKRIRLEGHVQGVGFRPFVYRLALQHGLSGNVQNQLGIVEIVASGGDTAVAGFVRDLVERAPPLAAPEIVSIEAATPPSQDAFEIMASASDSEAQVFVPPDYFMCADCRRELHDVADRRHAYPFINCTQCGPRYTLIRALPYDRANTSMAGFPLCPACEQEYRDPADRRFHAEPVACLQCGPQLSYAQPGGDSIDAPADALAAAIATIADGGIVAIKGIGGYHLVCDACNAEAVAQLRRRKRRPDKPLAVMFPLAGDDGLDAVSDYVHLGEDEAALLAGPVRPILLATRNRDTSLAAGIAPGLDEIGVFLPYSPLHELLLSAYAAPVVATSGNISGEPVLTDNDEAARRLATVADGFLHHDRPIVRPADDPVYRRIAGGLRPLRIGRGCAPREMRLPWRLRRPVLAVGGHMKGTVALGWDDRVVVSPHIGEMDSPRSLDVFAAVAADLQALYGVNAERVVCDAHPGYTTHRWAQNESRLPVDTVWHHEAHCSALVAEVDGPGPWLVFAWDGVGLGRDGTLWGGEAFLGTPGNWRRFASLRRFRLPGGDKAGREPWRSAAALHWECGRAWPECPDQDGLARAAWEHRVNSPETSAAGRLFDAAAAIICELPVTSFEAQGPMRLEAMCSGASDAIDLPLAADEQGVLRSDWEPLLPVLVDASMSPDVRARIFHSSLASAILGQAAAAREQHGVTRVGLTGGVFQNRVLTEQVVALLADAGFDVHLPLALPCNDAGLSYGQAAELAAREEH